MGKNKRLIKNIMLFMLSKFIPKTISFFLVPFYTIFLTSYEYGVVDLLNTTVLLIIPIFTLNIKDAVLRFTLDKSEEKDKIFNIPFYIVGINFFILSILTFLEYKFSILNINIVYILYFDFMCLTHSLYDCLTSFCKGVERVKLIVMVSILNSITTLLLNILLISCFRLSVFGYVVANTLGYALSIIIYIVFGRFYRYFKIKIDKNQLLKMINYSFPMIFSALAWWVNNSSDKYIVSWLLGISASGTYSISSKLPSILIVFQNIFMEAWSISAINNYNKNDNDGFFGSTFNCLVCVLSILCSILISFNILISKLLFHGEFFIAWKYVPPLLISVFSDALALFIGNIFYAVKDTKSRAFVTLIAAAVNTVLNFVLIYYFGCYGAAIATLIGYTCGFVLSAIIVKRYIKMKANLGRIVLTFLLLVVQMILAYFGNRYLYLQIIETLCITYLFKDELFLLVKSTVIIVKKYIKNYNKVSTDC